LLALRAANRSSFPQSAIRNPKSPTVPAPEQTRFSDRLAVFVRRYFLWLLIGFYVLATVVPGPGRAIRGWQWETPRFANVTLASLLLLAVMLFIAAILTDLKQVRVVSRHPFVLLTALVAVWLGPAILVIVADRLVPAVIDPQAAAGLMISFTLIASMPVANSSVGWSQSAGGNLGLSLALVVVSILLSPWVTPTLQHFLGASLGESDREFEEMVNQFSGAFFIIWVILPTAAGIASRILLTPARVESARSWLTVVSAAALLLLNYLSSVLALPEAHKATAGQLLVTLLMATSLAIVGILLAWLIAHLFRMRPETRTALTFGLSMKHTGLALIVASTVLDNQPLAILLIVLATLLQHIVAGIVQWALDHNLTTEEVSEAVQTKALGVGCQVSEKKSDT
jgi:BASS family bile acid:Na+ symporter